jgi:hypothetical protein
MARPIVFWAETDTALLVLTLVVIAERIASSFSRRLIEPASRKNAPRRFYAHYRPPPGIGLEAMCVLCLCGPAGEQFCGSPDDGGGQADYDMAREYLARAGYDFLRIEAEIVRLRDAADRLIRTPFVQDRIQVIVAALLRQGTLTGDEIGAFMISVDA